MSVPVSPPAAPVEAGNPSTKLYASDLVEMGRFWCSPRHPEFRTAGRITSPTIVFPETAVWIQHDGGRPFLGSPARVAMYNTGQPYTRRAHDADGDRCTWFAVGEELARDIVAVRDPRAADSDRVLPFAFGWVAPTSCLRARRLARLPAAHATDALLVEEAIVHLFTDVLADVYDHQCAASATLTKRQHDTVEHVAAQLYSTCTANHTLSVLAASVDLSVFHLCRLFRRATGMTMHAYRHHVRLAMALDALGTQDIDLLGLAVNLGYSSHSHFTSTFRRHFGVVPSDARGQLAGVAGCPVM